MPMGLIFEFSLMTLISAVPNVISACTLVSADNFVKLSDIIGFSQGVQKHLAMWINAKNKLTACSAKHLKRMLFNSKDPFGRCRNY